MGKLGSGVAQPHEAHVVAPEVALCLYDPCSGGVAHHPSIIGRVLPHWAASLYPIADKRVCALALVLVCYLAPQGHRLRRRRRRCLVQQRCSRCGHVSSLKKNRVDVRKITRIRRFSRLALPVSFIGKGASWSGLAWVAGSKESIARSWASAQTRCTCGPGA